MYSRIRRYISETGRLLRSIPSPVVTFFVVGVVLMNLLANKTIYQSSVIALDGGFTVSWVAFLCMDIMTGYFGAGAATRVSLFALCVNLMVVALFALVSAIPTETDYSAFNTIFGYSWFIVLSSSVAFISSAVVNNRLNALIGSLFKANPDGRAAYCARCYVSTFVGQFIDNMVFAAMTFMLFAPIYWDGFRWTLLQCITCSLVGAVLELLMEVIFSPIGYRVVRSWRNKGIRGGLQEEAPA